MRSSRPTSGTIDGRRHRLGRGHAVERSGGCEDAGRQRHDDAARGAADQGSEVRRVCLGLRSPRPSPEAPTTVCARLRRSSSDTSSDCNASRPMWITASACSSAARSGTAVGPHAECAGPPRPSLAGRKDVHQVAARAEEGCELRQHETGASGQDEAEPPASADVAVARQVGCDAAMAERERPVHQAARHQPTGDGADRPERERIVHLVDQLGASFWRPARPCACAPNA